MTIPTTTTGTTKLVENDPNTDSAPWDGVLLNNGSGVAVVWGDYLTTNIYLTMLNHGGSVGANVPLNLGTLGAGSFFHVAAAGTSGFVVVADDGDDGNPPYTTAEMRVFDSAGNPTSSTINLGTYRYYDVTGVSDGSFIVTWFNDGTQQSMYTHYTSNGTAIANQTNKTLLSTITNTLSVAGDANGGFMYSTPATNTNTADGSRLTYVDASGVEHAVTTVSAGYKGTLAYDGTNFWLFYSDSSDIVHATKISGTTHSVLATYDYTDFTSHSTPIVKILPNGNFLIEDFNIGNGQSTKIVKVDNAGHVLEQYPIAPGEYAWFAPTSDSGGVIIRNYDSGNTKFDTTAIEAFGSNYLDPIPPTITTPAALGFTDTNANDSFSASTAATLSISSDTTITGRGISGGTTGGSQTINGVTYDVSKAGTYGILYLQSSTGKYTYVPNSSSINALLANASDSFTVTATNAASSPGSATLTVNITGVDDLPVLANLNGHAGTFKAGASNPVADGDYIAPGTVSLTDVDSTNLASGNLQINLTSGTNDGYFFTDVNKVKIGTDGRFTAGESVYVDVSGAGTSYVQIGTVGSGGVLHIDLNSNATPTNVTFLIKNLTYSSATEGLRNFTLTVNDGDGGTSASSAFSMNGTDGTPPTLGSATPADNATDVALATSPQITFSEAVKFGTAGKIYLVDVAANTVVEQFDVTSTHGTADGQVSISGSTLTINPTASLDFSKAYAIKIDSGAITDIAGNAYAGITDTTTLNFTTVADPAPAVNSIALNTPASAATNADSLTFLVTFSKDVSATLDATDFAVTGSTATVTAVSAAGGNAWQVTVSGGDLASYNGTVGLSISAGNNITDTAGHALVSTTPTGVDQAYTLDNAVSAPAFALHTDTGASNSDGITKDGTVNVTLAADVASWEYSVDGGANWAPGSGTSFTLAEGSYAGGAVQVRQTDQVGNLSTAQSNASAITIDTAAAAPTFALAADTGAGGSDGITNNGIVNVTLAADAASWEYSADGGASWHAGSGSSFTLAEGMYASAAVQVRYTDTAGNLSSPASSAAAITIDHTVAAPGLTLPADSGASTSDGITKNTTVTVALDGDVASWEYSVDGGAHWATGSGTSFTLAEGSYAAGAVQVHQTDLAGNVSVDASSGSAITIDTTASTPALALDADTGSSGSDGITGSGTIDVSALPADTASWEYSVDGGANWTGGSGTSFTLTERSYASGDVQVRYTDTAGNVSAATSNAASITVDTSAPVPSLSLAADSGSSASDGITSNATVNVTLPGDTASWQYSVDGGTSWTTGSGSSFDLAEGQYASGAVQVRYTDLAGNASTAASSTGAINVDQTVAAPALALDADNGSSASDGITSDPNMNVTLASDVASWQYSVDGGASWTTGTGTSFTLADGMYAAGDLQVRQTDIAGNVSTAAASAAAITIATSAAAPTFALHQDAGDSSSDGISNNGTVDVTLPATQASWEYSVDSGGNWVPGSGSSFALDEGSYASGTVQVRYMDVAGNQSPAAGNAAAISIDHTVPQPTLQLAADTGTSNSDGLTNNTAINVTLAADVASWEYSSDSGATWANGTGTHFDLADGAYAAGAVLVRQTDIAGNVSSNAANTGTITIDTAAAAPALALAGDTGASASDGITSNGSVNVTLPGDAASWQYSVDGGAHWLAGSAASFTLAEGSYASGAVQTRYTDNAGNVSTAASNPATLNVDQTVAAPALALAADTGTSSSDGLTNNPSVNVTLASDVASWEYSVDGGADWATGTGTAFTLTDGSYAMGAVQVRQTDIAGNLSAATANPSAITIDTSAAAPALALSSDTGASSSDGITSVGIVNVTLPGDTASWQYSADGGGHWAAGSGTSFTLATGSYAGGDVQVRYTDNAGNVSAAASNLASITIDASAPVPSLSLAADSGSSASDGITSNATVNVTLPGDTASWQYSTDGGASWTTGSGSSFDLAEGQYASGAVQVRYTDLAGNASTAASSTGAITVDKTVAAPALALDADNGSSASDGITSDPNMNVTLASDVASWQYSADGGASWTTGTGTSFTLADGMYAAGDLQVRQTDIAGNVSTATANAAAITIATSAAAPTFALHQDAGDSSNDGITNNGTVDVTLPATQASWEYSVDSGASWTPGAGTGFTLGEGSYASGTVQVRYMDVAGNQSPAASNAAAISIDHTVPQPTLQLAADNGTSNSDGLTNNTAINVTLAADVASWEYSSDSGATWTGGTGTHFDLGDGAYAAGAVLVRQTDIAGNVSSNAANTGTITIDTAAAAPALALAGDTGASASDGITSNGSVNVTLPGDTASWEYSIDHGASWNAGSGTSLTLSEGAYASGTVQVRYTDNAGNLSAAGSNGAALTIDRTATAPVLLLASDTGSSSSDGISNSPTVNVTLAVDVASWEFSVDGGANWTAGTGTTFALADGSYAAGAVQVRETDIAGNVSAATTNPAAITIDRSAAAPAFALDTDTGASNSDGITSVGTVNVTLPVDTASWQYSIDGGSHWNTGTGTSFTLAENSYAGGDVQVRYTDIAGNVSTAATNPGAVTVDNTVTAPALALAADTGTSSSDGLTNNGNVNVTLASDVASWEYSVDGGASWRPGSGTSFTLADGSYAAGALQVRQTDLAGNQSAAAASTAAIAVDTAAAAPAYALAVDSGKSTSDNISTDGTVNVTLPGDMASWEYSVDAGASWTAGSGTSFTLADGSYAGGVVQVRYTDNAGNLSTAASNAATISIDNTALAPVLALDQDTGANNTDGVTTDATINVALPADVASWEYSVDAGAHWSTGTGAHFSLSVGKHVAGSVEVRYTDLAGNHSPAGANAGDYTIEHVAVPPPPTPVIIDGVTIEHGTINNADGSTSQVLNVPVVLPTRVDDIGNHNVADIPLVGGSNGAPPPLSAQVPTGYGLQVTGSASAQAPGTAVNELARAISAHTTNGSTDQSSLLGSGSGFLDHLPQNTQLLVQSVTPTIAAGTPAGTPLVISAPASTPGAPVTALVIDATHLPSGTNIQLENVDFAALIGPMRATGGEGQQTVFGDSASQYIVLGPDDDVLHGGAGNDIVGSEGGNDQIYGDEGNDLVFGGAGNDYVDGGTGTDTVLLQGASRADYSFRFDHGNLVATQLHGGPDGTDTIANVELIQFAGAAPDMGVDATLRRVYETAFDRAPDQAGAAFWSAQSGHGMSMHDIAANLVAAPEAAGMAKLGNAAFVDQLYLDALGAQPLQPASAADRAHWVGLLDQGTADRADVLVGIANSTQMLALDAQAQSQVAFADTDAATLVRLYATVFGRQGDEAGLNYWIAESESGMTMNAIVNGFLQSSEGQQHYGNTTDSQFVDALYSIGLGRHASADEVAWWSDKLHTGALSRTDVVLFFTDSPEQVALVGHSTTIPWH